MKTKNLSKVSIDKTSIHFKFASWTLKHQKLTKVLLAVACGLILISWLSLYFIGKNHTSKTENVTIFKNLSTSPTDNSWQVISKQKKSETFECYRYRKANKSEMTACYELRKTGWEFVTSY